MKEKMLTVILLTLTLIFSPIYTDAAVLSENIQINKNPSNWTNGNVVLEIQSNNVSTIMMPNGVMTSYKNPTYTVYNNGTYSFVGYNSDGEVMAIGTSVVSNIDRVKKDGQVIPGDSKWKNQDIQVRVEILPSNNK